MGTHPIYDTLLDNYIREHPKVKDGAGESFVCILPKES